MSKHSNSSEPPTFDLHSNAAWQKLYLLLRPLVKHWVYSSQVPSWKGQEDDVIEDIVQEAILRLYNYAQRAEQGEVDAIDAIEHLLKVIAHNYCRDLQRREQRLQRLSPDDWTYGEVVDSSKVIDASELATDKVYQEWLFEKLSHEVVNFPYKQRKALLKDIANRMFFDKQPTLLQQAFRNVGIQLQDYQGPLPINSVERTRHASLLSLAYKKVSKVTYN